MDITFDHQVGTCGMFRVQSFGRDDYVTAGSARMLLVSKGMTHTDATIVLRYVSAAVSGARTFVIVTDDDDRTYHWVIGGDCPAEPCALWCDCEADDPRCNYEAAMHG